MNLCTCTNHNLKFDCTAHGPLADCGGLHPRLAELEEKAAGVDRRRVYADVPQAGLFVKSE